MPSTAFPNSFVIMTSQRHISQVVANKCLTINAAEPNVLIYNQIIRLSINASAAISLLETPRHFSSSKLAVQGDPSGNHDKKLSPGRKKAADAAPSKHGRHKACFVPHKAAGRSK